MKKVLANLISSFAASFLAAWGSGIPPKEAAIAAGIATAANLAGLVQKKPEA
jgi:hypothetical protein